MHPEQRPLPADTQGFVLFPLMYLILFNLYSNPGGRHLYPPCVIGGEAGEVRGKNAMV